MRHKTGRGITSVCSSAAAVALRLRCAMHFPPLSAPLPRSPTADRSLVKRHKTGKVSLCHSAERIRATQPKGGNFSLTSPDFSATCCRTGHPKSKFVIVSLFVYLNTFLQPTALIVLRDPTWTPCWRGDFPQMASSLTLPAERTGSTWVHIREPVGSLQPCSM